MRKPTNIRTDTNPHLVFGLRLTPGPKIHRKSTSILFMLLVHLHTSAAMVLETTSFAVCLQPFAC